MTTFTTGTDAQITKADKVRATMTRRLAEVRAEGEAMAAAPDADTGMVAHFRTRLAIVEGKITTATDAGSFLTAFADVAAYGNIDDVADAIMQGGNRALLIDRVR